MVGGKLDRETQSRMEVAVSCAMADLRAAFDIQVHEANPDATAWDNVERDLRLLLRQAYLRNHS